MDADLVLPGPVFHDLEGRIKELLRHHETLTLYERCFALAETLAHLDHLALEGRAERVGEARYAASLTL